MCIVNHHKLDESDNNIEIEALGDPGPGGGYREYSVTTPLPGDNSIAVRKKVLGKLDFQSGPIPEVGIDGLTNEVLLAIVSHRLECFQAGPFADHYNSAAFAHVRESLAALKARTRNRIERGVEGQLKP